MKVVKLNKNVELILACLGAFQSIYLALFSFFERKRHIKNYLLGLFFFSITIRIVKSILWVYLSETPNWFINLGFAAHLAFGPLLYLYTYYFVNEKSWLQINLLHFIPSFIILANSFSLTSNSFWNVGGYSMLLYHQLFYTLIIVYVFINGIAKCQKKEWLWLSLLVGGTVFLQFSYFSNYILGMTPYLLGPIVYGVYVFFLSFFLMKNPQFFYLISRKKKYNNINLSHQDLEARIKEIETLMSVEKPFLDSNFNLKQLSKSLGVPVYVMSHIINDYFNTNFSGYINVYRIEEAKKLLKHKDYQNIKISSIAYECGFNSLSAFNAAFKKHTGSTPSYYKRFIPDL
ncbi:helix-turn-helix transcriptional regulator [Flavivirga aquimarina]|uniref:Helix-turn-helix transcriptional regulator n=1 Tax=Flavivirga aquimarina TaxID=2027862 RepID=A0ABT8WG51_9FLAO|nr:helix-turn-helix transcriptional regulator [Flavivirga aquimarina]MDO5972134.1 helix-turn-helix transcriptional regulator [Flavivirga aquimarina]